MAIAVECPPLIAAHGYAAHGQGLSVLRAVAPARTGRTLDLRSVRGLPARASAVALHPPYQRGNGPPGRQAALSQTVFRHVGLRPDPGIRQRTNAVRRYDRIPAADLQQGE